MRLSFIYLILLFGSEWCPLQLLIKTTTTTVVSAAVTMNTTIPPMMATVLSLTELLVVVTLSSWEASEAAIKSNNYYSTLCSFELVPVEKGMVLAREASTGIPADQREEEEGSSVRLLLCSLPLSPSLSPFYTVYLSPFLSLPPSLSL